MGRIAKIKRLLIEEANKRLLNEQDPVGDDPNAGEIQKYLVDKGYLPRYRTENGEKKDNIDWDFGDISAKAFGDFIKDKLGVDVGIQSLQDLQDYLDLLGFETGDLGFGEKVYNAIKWIIDFTEKGVTNLINDPKINSTVKNISNIFLESLKGLTIDTIHRKSIDKGEKDCDYWVKYYTPKIKSLEFTNITHNTIDIKGSIGGRLHFKACETLGMSNWFGWAIDHEENNYVVNITGKIGFYFEFKEGKFCVNFNVIETSLNSENYTHFGTLQGSTTWKTKYYMSVNNNDLRIVKRDWVVGLDFKFSPVDKYYFTKIKTIPIVKDLNEKICGNGYCVEMDDIIKILKGSENVSNIPNLMVDMCPTKPKPEKQIKWTPIPKFEPAFEPYNAVKDKTVVNNTDYQNVQNKKNGWEKYK
jgi:hypothetical protein